LRTGRGVAASAGLAAAGTAFAAGLAATLGAGRSTAVAFTALGAGRSTASGRGFQFVGGDAAVAVFVQHAEEFGGAFEAVFRNAFFELGQGDGTVFVGVFGFDAFEHAARSATAAASFGFAGAGFAFAGAGFSAAFRFGFVLVENDGQDGGCASDGGSSAFAFFAVALFALAVGAGEGESGTDEERGENGDGFLAFFSLSLPVRSFPAIHSILVAAVLTGVALWSGGCGNTSANERLLVYCAAGMRLPMTELARAFETETGTGVDLQFAGSNTLLGNIAAAGQGDLYLAADASYIDRAREQELLREALPVAPLTAGLIVAKDNPKQLRSLAELATRDDLKIAIGNPDAAAVGKFTRKVLSELGQWEAVAERVTVTKPTVNEIANDVALGGVDVAVVWDAVAAQYPDTTFINVPELDAKRKQVMIGVLESSEQPARALAFARFVASRDRGQTVFSAHGHSFGEKAGDTDSAGGDSWVAQPELTVYCGAMLRPAVEERMRAFEEREGVRITRVYNGCGILVSQMRAGERPDAYFSCDQSFLDDVSEWFDEGRTVSGNPMVILATKQSAGKLNRLKDLAEPGWKVGLAHPEKSALGALTKKVLADAGLLDAVTNNRVVDSATGDFLVNQVRAGGLDAAIVYLSNARATPQTLEELRVVPIDRPGARAVQPFAVGTDSDHPQLCARLFEALTGAAERERFEALGFDWEFESD